MRLTKSRFCFDPNIDYFLGKKANKANNINFLNCYLLHLKKNLTCLSRLSNHVLSLVLSQIPSLCTIPQPNQWVAFIPETSALWLIHIVSLHFLPFGYASTLFLYIMGKGVDSMESFLLNYFFFFIYECSQSSMPLWWHVSYSVCYGYLHISQSSGNPRSSHNS